MQRVLSAGFIDSYSLSATQSLDRAVPTPSWQTCSALMGIRL